MCWPGQCTVVRYGACVCDTRGSNNCLFTYKQNEKVWWFPSLSELMRINKYSCSVAATRITFLKYIVLKSKYWHYLRGCLANLCIWRLKCFLKWPFSVPQWPKLLSKEKKINHYEVLHMFCMQIMHTTTKQFLFNTKNYAGTCMNLNWRFKILNKYKRR